MCVGEVERGMLVQDWLSTNFTDANRCRSPASTHVCEACVFVQSRTSPVPGRPPGKCKVCDGTGLVVSVPPKGKGSQSKKGDECPKCDDGNAEFGGNFRNYSTCWDEQGYVNASKGEKPIVREFLRREHAGSWFCGVADSGQKHVIPFCQLNGPGRSGLVLLDEQLIKVPSSFFLVDDMTDMLTRGVTKDELERGEYYVRSMKERRTEVEGFEARNSRERGGGWFKLALWLAQRDEDEFVARIELALRANTRARDVVYGVVLPIDNELAEAAIQKQKRKINARRIAEKETGNVHRGNAAGPAKRVPARTGRAPADELLRAATKPDAQRSSADGERERVGKPDAAKAPDRKPAQGRLPGFD